METKALYELCEKLNDEVRRANAEIRNKDKLSGSDLEWLDKVTHALKSVKTVIAMEEAGDDYSEGYMYDGMSYARGRGNRDGIRGEYSRDHYVDGHSYARGRTGNVKRDNMGRYSRDEAREDMVAKLRDLMQDADDPKMKSEFQHFISEIEQM